MSLEKGMSSDALLKQNLCASCDIKVSKFFKSWQELPDRTRARTATAWRCSGPGWPPYKVHHRELPPVWICTESCAEIAVDKLIMQCEQDLIDRPPAPGTNGPGSSESVQLRSHGARHPPALDQMVNNASVGDVQTTVLSYDNQTKVSVGHLPSIVGSPVMKPPTELLEGSLPLPPAAAAQSDAEPPASPFEKRSVEAIAKWLANNGFPTQADAVRQHNVDGEALQAAADSVPELQNLGFVTVMQRRDLRKLLDAERPNLSTPGRSRFSDTTTAPLGVNNGAVVRDGKNIGAGWTEIPANEVEVDTAKVLGGGSFKVVYKGTWHGTEVAVARVNDATRMPADLLSDLRAELYVLGRLRHPNVVTLMGACTTLPTIQLVLEFMDRGSLYHLLHVEKVVLQSAQQMNTMVHIVRGVAFLHGQRVCHRDIKSSNVLLDGNLSGNLTVKLCDMGLAHFKSAGGSKTSTGDHLVSTKAGTYMWMAPEVMGLDSATQKYDGYAADVYGMALVLYEVASGKMPYPGLNEVQLGLHVSVKGKRPPIDDIRENWSSAPSVLDVIEEAWVADPTARPRAQAVLSRLQGAPTPAPAATQQTGCQRLDDLLTALGEDAISKLDRRLVGSLRRGVKHLSLATPSLAEPCKATLAAAESNDFDTFSHELTANGSAIIACSRHVSKASGEHVPVCSVSSSPSLGSSVTVSVDIFDEIVNPVGGQMPVAFGEYISSPDTGASHPFAAKLLRGRSAIMALCFGSVDDGSSSSTCPIKSIQRAAISFVRVYQRGDEDNINRTSEEVTELRLEFGGPGFGLQLESCVVSDVNATATSASDQVVAALRWDVTDPDFQIILGEETPQNRRVLLGLTIVVELADGQQATLALGVWVRIVAEDVWETRVMNLLRNDRKSLKEAKMTPPTTVRTIMAPTGFGVVATNVALGAGAVAASLVSTCDDRQSKSAVSESIVEAAMKL